MKKLTLFMLVCSLASAESTFATSTRDVADTVAQAVKAPFVAVKNTIIENEIDQDALDVLGQLRDFPGQRWESAKEVASDLSNTSVGQAIKNTNQKVVDATKNAASTVKEATVQVGTKVANAAGQTTTNIKNATARVVAAVKSGATTVKTKTREVLDSEAVEDIQDVGQQLFVDAPKQVAEGVVFLSQAVWGKILSVGKTIKSEFTE